MKRAIFVAVAVSVLVPQAAFGGDTEYAVSIANLAFAPAEIEIPLSDAVRWENQDPVAHTSTGSSGPDGLGYWDSGSITPAGSFVKGFYGSGTFPYSCTIHPEMRGTVGVPLALAPSTGPPGTVFGINWAFGSVEAGYNAGVQLKKPHKRFKGWFVDQQGEDVGTDYRPGKKGKYKVRARLQNNATGGASDWSPVLVFTVT